MTVLRTENYLKSQEKLMFATIALCGRKFSDCELRTALNERSIK